MHSSPCEKDRCTDACLSRARLELSLTVVFQKCACNGCAPTSNLMPRLDAINLLRDSGRSTIACGSSMLAVEHVRICWAFEWLSVHFAHASGGSASQEAAHQCMHDPRAAHSRRPGNFLGPRRRATGMLPARAAAVPWIRQRGARHCCACRTAEAPLAWRDTPSHSLQDTWGRPAAVRRRRV